MFTRVDEDLLEELEETLILCDVGVNTATRVIGTLRERIKAEKIREVDGVKAALKEILLEQVQFSQAEETFPRVILVVGVNGAGKTTSIGKIAHVYTEQGKKVLLAAADTFRAAAAEQLSIWADRAGVPIVKYGEGHDPAAVVYDAIDSAKHRGMDVVLCDTAGRLHNKKNLMNELGKISRVIDREYPDAGNAARAGWDGGAEFAVPGAGIREYGANRRDRPDQAGWDSQGRVHLCDPRGIGHPGEIHRRGRGDRRLADLRRQGICRFPAGLTSKNA